jgi:DNA invertase Pin-like site-specific DNA recombinase
MSTKYIAYYRVSTKSQGQSGLGLEAQKTAVRQFVKCDGPAEWSELAPMRASGPCIIDEFVEVESGKNNNREQLQLTIDTAKKKGCRLIIAKLDRLSRNAGLIFALRDSGVDFVCADMPDANTLTIGIFATLAQHERELISSRTKAALAAKKKGGVKLGKPENLTYEHRVKGGKVKAYEARQDIRNKQAAKIIVRCRNEKKMTLEQVARELNEDGYRTRMGKLFTRMAVKRLYDRSNVI